MADLVRLEQFTNWVTDFGGVIHDNAGYLTDLDSAIGDADHGINMDRGMKAAVVAVGAEEFGSPGALFKKVGMTLVSTVGGASGPLYGTFFLRFGAALGDQTEVSAELLGEAFHAGVTGIQARGKPELGDKTMYDAWVPMLEAYDDAVSRGEPLAEVLTAAARAAATGRDATVPLVARKGRASYLGDRSADHLDPGAASATMLVESAAKTLGHG